jgi:uncharacterized protein YqjF (DUF2071 family)
MVDHDFNAAVLEHVAHRPWPMPQRPWLMTQTWHDLLFAHWRVEPAALAGIVPPQFPLDLFGGEAWVGVVPFRMTNVAPRGVPSLPWISEFPELNLRTYVRVGDRPGIYFFSLDAGSVVAVRAARTLLNLPYYAASMRVTRSADRVEYASARQADPSVVLTGTYGPTGAAAPPAPGSLDHFLTERYCLYHLDRRGAPYRLDIHHPPWPLQPAQAELFRNTLGAPVGLTLPEPPALLHFARRQDMVAWGPVRL